MSKARYKQSSGVLTALLALGLAACGGGGDSADTDSALTTVGGNAGSVLHTVCFCVGR